MTEIPNTLFSETPRKVDQFRHVIFETPSSFEI